MQSILCTLFCCLPFGIVGIVYASHTKARINSGDVAGAWAASNKARLWCWLSFGFGLALTVLWLIVRMTRASSAP